MLFMWRAGCCDLCCDWNAMVCVVNYAVIGVARENVSHVKKCAMISNYL